MHQVQILQVHSGMRLVQKPEVCPFVPSDECPDHLCSNCTLYSKLRAIVQIYFSATVIEYLNKSSLRRKFIWLTVFAVGKSRQQDLEAAASITFSQE